MCHVAVVVLSSQMIIPINKKMQDIFGLRSRSRRGSVAVIPEDSTATGRCSAESGVSAANRRFSGGAVGRQDLHLMFFFITYLRVQLMNSTFTFTFTRNEYDIAFV